MWQFLLAVLILLVTIYYMKLCLHKRKYAKFYSLPGPKRYPIIGHGYLFLTKQFFNIMQDVFQKTGLPCLLYLPEPHYCTADPNDVRILHNHPDAMRKSELYTFFQTVFKNGLIFAPPELWRKNRKLIAKAFNKGNLDSLVPIFYKNSCVLKERLVDCKDLFLLFQSFAFNNFIESGGSDSLQYEEVERIVKMFQRSEELSNLLEIQSKQWLDKKLKFSSDIVYLLQKTLLRLSDSGQEIIINRVASPFTRFNIIYMWTKSAKLLDEYLKESYRIITSALTKQSGKAHDTVDSLFRLPLFQLLIKLQEDGKYSEKDLFFEILTFAVAGTDTSGYTMSFVFTLLGMHPEIQEKVYQEVMTVVGPTKQIEYTDLPNLKYMEMVIWETMRILPVAPIIGRKADADIDIGRCVIPSGSNINIAIFNIHRNEKYYPNPLEFNPDRFLPEEVAKRDPFTFIPFSIGTRNCIGWLYSLMVMKTTIPNIIRDYKVSSKHKSVTEFNLESGIILKTNPPPDCHFTRRSN